MIARVALEIALRREFDYLVPEDLRDLVDTGSRVKVPFGHRKVFGVVTAVRNDSPHTNLKTVEKVVGGKSLVTPRVLELARWISDYYCCPLETALKSVLPESVRREKEGWKKQLFVRALPLPDDMPKLTKKQNYVWNIIEEWRELTLQELIRLGETTADTIRRLEDKGMVLISTETIERDPYANEHILPTQPLALNPEQKSALDAILSVLNGGANKCAAGSLSAESGSSIADHCQQDAESTLRPVGIEPMPIAEEPAPGSIGTIFKESPFFDPDAEIERYSGWLPHWRQSNRLYFVTYRLADCVDQLTLKSWQNEKRIWLDLHPKPWSADVSNEYCKRFTDRVDQYLDKGFGECLLQRPGVAEIVEQSLLRFDGDRYQLGAFVVMPNHVHVLVRPAEDWSLERIVHSWKSYTGNQINKLLGRSGPVWMEEYFDHLVRSTSQLEKFESYVRQNPAKAGLADGAFRLCRGGFSRDDAHNVSGSSVQSAAGSLPSGLNSPALENCQQAAGSTLQRPAITSQAPLKTFLLHGVTGSGKTEVYLQAIARSLELGKGAIVLVPEISLTPQTVERFKARFSSGPLRTLVAVLHSHLSAGEKHDEWHKIRQGRAKIVIGARSAIFAPVEPLGLIIVDEEHEHSYKQEEAPRYHARDVAVLRGQKESAVVVLGSATPSLETYHNAIKGKYAMLELPHRADNAKMPIIRVVDMRQEMRRQKGSPIFSVQLREAILQRLERKEQTILFLNRRGYATSMQCPACGYVAECPNCSVALTYHRREQKLKCHICGFDSPAPTRCPEPKCGSREIRYAGLGTEKLEDALTQGFPHAKLARMDSDTLKKKEDYRRILTDFRLGRIDILVGTQMIAKGLHFPNVTLVGIIYADLSLHLPDFRAGERTFQLLTQVAGRAGRGDIEGEVFVQSFTPFHPAIQYARRHDFVGFYEQEVEFREQLKYPPLTRIALITVKGRNEDKVSFLAEHVRKEMGAMMAEMSDLVVAGPAPAPLARAETFYRYQLMLRTRHMSSLSKRLNELIKNLKLPEGVLVTVDVDPVNLF
ncbi:primosomal protein N' [bacterium]|nr:primosomal protein N' [bacterium]